MDEASDQKNALPRRIVSGGQTGADRAALDAALAAGVPIGGWCPRGCRGEDGPLEARYPLRETPSARPAQRTCWNVRDSDATLILLPGASEGASAEGGTRLTIDMARAMGRPLHVAHLAEACPEHVRRWIAARAVAVLNVAGPRESEAPGVYAAARAFMEHVLAR